MFLLALIGYLLPHERVRNDIDFGRVIEGGKEVIDAWKDGAPSDEDEIAKKVGETAKGATKIIQGFTNEEANIPLATYVQQCRSRLNSVAWLLMKLAVIPRGWEDQADATALDYIQRADAALKAFEPHLLQLKFWVRRDPSIQDLIDAYYAMSKDLREEKIRFHVSNESRSWASFCKAFLKVWDVIVKVVDAIFRGNDFDENVLLDAVEQKLGRSFQTRQITRTRVDGGVWVRGTADDIALSAYYHDSRAHSVAIRTGLEAKILPERQQVAQAGEWAVAIGPVESADGNQALYKLE